MARKTIAKTLEEQRTLIFNSSKPQIAPLLADLGVDGAFLKKGEQLYTSVTNLIDQQKKEQQEESLAYDNFHEKKEICKAAAKRNLKIIKLASRTDKDLQNRLKLFVPKEYAIEEWIKQTHEHYNLVLNEATFLKSLTRFKITAKTIQADQAQLDSLKQFRNEAMSEKGQAQEATRLRNEAMESLEDYCYELKTLASIALEDQPQLFEMLGVVVPN